LVVLLLGLRQVLPPSVRTHDDAMLRDGMLSVVDTGLFANERHHNGRIWWGRQEEGCQDLSRVTYLRHTSICLLCLPDSSLHMFKIEERQSVVDILLPLRVRALADGAPCLIHSTGQPTRHNRYLDTSLLSHFVRSQMCKSKCRSQSPLRWYSALDEPHVDTLLHHEPAAQCVSMIGKRHY